MIQEYATVMENNTICIPKSVRERHDLHKGDKVIFKNRNQDVILKKAPSSWHDLLGIGKKAYAAYGGGEKYLKHERAGWSQRFLHRKKKT